MILKIINGRKKKMNHIAQLSPRYQFMNNVYLDVCTIYKGIKSNLEQQYELFLLIDVIL